jgi:hypothetical protein
MPVIVIVWAERSACALLIMGKGAARSDAGKANTSAKASIDMLGKHGHSAISFIMGAEVYARFGR